jgi:hypothetical protein
MRRIRPTSVTVIAILQLVFGCLWLLCGLGSLAMQATGMNNMFMNMGNVQTNNPQLAKQQEIQKEVMQFSKEQSSGAGQYASLLQYVVLSVLMILSGIGLLQMKSWGWVLSLVYATLSILSNIALAVYIWFVVVPAVQAFADKLAAQGPEAQVMAGLLKFGSNFSIVTPVLSLIYPIIALILMLRPSVVAAFRGEAATSPNTEARTDQFEAEDRWGRG